MRICNWCGTKRKWYQWRKHCKDCYQALVYAPSPPCPYMANLPGIRPRFNSMQKSLDIAENRANYYKGAFERMCVKETRNSCTSECNEMHTFDPPCELAPDSTH